MPVSVTDTPCLFEGLYSMKLGDNTLYYNPLGFGGVTVVDSSVAGLINQCDGTRNLSAISRLTGHDIDDVLADIQVLADREVLYVSPQFTKSLRKNQQSKSLTCWIHLTNRCNLACDYCYIHKTPGDMRLETAITVVDKMLASCRLAGIFSISLKFSGGEPLLRFDDLRRIVEYTESVRGDIKARYVVLTNAVLVTPRIAEYFAEKNFGVGTSLDGLREIHDVARHTPSNAGSFNGVIRGIELLTSAGVSPSVNITITDTNYKGLQEVTRLILERGWTFRYSLQRDTDSGNPAVLRYEAEVIEELNACYDIIEEFLPERDITQMHQFGDVVFNRSVNRACGAGASFFSVGHAGELGVCGLGLAAPKGNLYDEGDLLTNVRHNNATFASGNAKHYEDCSQCYWRGSCAGACPLQTLSSCRRMEVKSPYCEIYKAVLPRILKIKGLQMIRDFESEGKD
jgi:uncharacterized protein